MMTSAQTPSTILVESSSNVHTKTPQDKDIATSCASPNTVEKQDGEMKEETKSEISEKQDNDDSKVTINKNEDINEDTYHEDEKKEDDTNEDKSDDEMDSPHKEEDKKITTKSRRELPPHTVGILKGWMLSPEHVKHPYPTDEDKQMLLKKTGINMKQLTNWFTNARKRIWKPMMRREHSRQLQNRLEYDNPRPHEGYLNPQVGSYREGPHVYTGHPLGPRPISNSFDVGSLRPSSRIPPSGHMQHEHPHAMNYYPQHPQHPHTMEMYRGHPHHPHTTDPHSPHEYYGRPSRSASESSRSIYIEDHMDPSRRKRLHSAMDHPDPHMEKRIRRNSPIALSPRALKILEDFVHIRGRSENPHPTETDVIELARTTGLDVHQVEMWFRNAGYSGPHNSLRPGPGNPSYPPPNFPERRSVPSSDNPMFPPRPSRSSIPGSGNSQFPPPPSMRRDARPAYSSYSSGPHAHGIETSQSQYNDASGYRPVRSLSINAPLFPRRTPQDSSSVLPSLSSRPGTSHAGGSVHPSPRPGPGPIVQNRINAPVARDGRSHTIDMGHFTEARRRKMNFQDILDSESSSRHPQASIPIPSFRRRGEYPPHPTNSNATESIYPPSYASSTSSQRVVCSKCRAAPGTCECHGMHPQSGMVLL